MRPVARCLQKTGPGKASFNPNDGPAWLLPQQSAIALRAVVPAAGLAADGLPRLAVANAGRRLAGIVGLRANHDAGLLLVAAAQGRGTGGRRPKRRGCSGNGKQDRKPNHLTRIAQRDGALSPFPRAAERRGTKLLKNSPWSFRDATKRQARNPDASGFPALGSKCTN